MPDDRDTINAGVSMPVSLWDRVLDSMGPRETNRSKRIRELVTIGLATEEAAAKVGWSIPTDPREQRHMLAQAFRDADRYQQGQDAAADR